MALVQSQISFPCTKLNVKRKLLTENKSLTATCEETLGTKYSEESVVLEKRVTRARTRAEVVKAVSPYKKSPRKNCHLSSPKEQSPVKAQPTSDENSKLLNEDAKPKLKLSIPDVSVFMKARQALHTSVPESIVGRDKEIQEIASYLEDHVTNRKSGSMYISGAPGTGKTASVMHILSSNMISGPFQHCFINCMKLKTAASIYSEIARHWDKKWESRNEDPLDFLEKKATRKGPMLVVVLDEIDHMSSKTQSVLYTLFELPALEKSRVILLGLANSLDLTDRILVRLQSRVALKPHLVHFSPYTRQQITAILSQRVKEAISDEVNNVITPSALQYLSSKISATSGDLRKALDVCRRAVELAECSAKKQLILSATENVVSGAVKAVDIGLVSKLINTIQTHSFCMSHNETEETMPIQHKIAIATLVVLAKHGKSKQVTVGQMHNSYTKICKKFNLTPMDFGEFLNTCVLIDSKGIFAVKRKPDARLSTVHLRLDEREVESALQDKTLVASILTQASDFI